MTIPTAFGACLLVIFGTCSASAQGRALAPAASAANASPARSSAAIRHAGSVPKLRIGAPVAYFDDRGAERTVERVTEREPVRFADPFAFENLPVRTGIRPPPTPNPTIYRISGPKQRPTIRVIPIGLSEPQGGVRGRFHDPRSGAAVLFVDDAQRRLAR